MLDMIPLFQNMDTCVITTTTIGRHDEQQFGYNHDKYQYAWCYYNINVSNNYESGYPFPHHSISGKYCSYHHYID